MAYEYAMKKYLFIVLTLLCVVSLEAFAAPKKVGVSRYFGLVRLTGCRIMRIFVHGTYRDTAGASAGGNS